MFVLPETTMLVLKRNIKAPGSVDYRFRCVCTRLGVLNTRKIARCTLWDPSAAGAKRAGVQQDGAWGIAWRARGPVASLWTVKTLVFAVGRAINDRRGAGRVGCVCARYEKTEPPVSGDSAIKILGFGASATG